MLSRTTPILLIILLAGCGGEEISDESELQDELVWSGREESTNVIDTRPRACAASWNCVQGLVQDCPANFGAADTYTYNTGLCRVDTDGNLTSVCFIQTVCCATGEPRGWGGCEPWPEAVDEPNKAADHRAAAEADAGAEPGDKAADQRAAAEAEADAGTEPGDKVADQDAGDGGDAGVED